MTVAVLGPDLGFANVVATLLRRAGVKTHAVRVPRDVTSQRRHAQAFARDGATVCVIDPLGDIDDAVPLPIAPSLAAWLTRDPAANRAVLGTDEVPPAATSATWLADRNLPDGRRFATSIDGVALAAQLDLGGLAAFAPAFRDALARLNPTWASTQAVRRGRGRPPGVAIFRGTGYALCLELLHRGDRAEVTPTELVAALGRTKTPTLRFVNEALRRGYLRRTSPRGPLVVRNCDRILDDLVTAAQADQRRSPRPTFGVRTDRDPAGLPSRLARSLGVHGRVLAITGSAAVRDRGGDHLSGGPILAFASLAGVDTMLGDAYRDLRDPQLVLIEPTEPAVLHRLRPGTPPQVSPWQAVVDLLTSHSERERETGNVVRRHLEAHRP
ncbi:MAG: hypothetical protein JNK64_23755 [Myxococcales bacterium]|nr:hypothetical protein [Myxococcales bacterium]